MPDIMLTTLNAKYIHTAFGLRYLLANLGPLRSSAGLAEFDINQRPVDIAERLLSEKPRIIGFGVYVWNVGPTTEVVAAIKRLQPETTIVLGGPEVSYETDRQQLVELADYVITGEADLEFGMLCQQLLEDQRPDTKIIDAEPPDFSQLTLPYDLYTDQDLAHRVIYVEASRGCPFSCEFCLSSLGSPVRQTALSEFLDQLRQLLARGATHFKFVDRSFNLNPRTGSAILEFLLEQYRPGHLFHFELVPDPLPEAMREVIRKFPRGALQFEVGVQTFNPEVAARIHRRQANEQIEETLRFLRRQSGAHIHADLIAGLPGETIESFADGFDRLVELEPQEIQVGILKRLRGAPIARHDVAWAMVYNPYPPYEILQNSLIDFQTMQKLRRFARYWDLVSNSGNFVETAPLIWSAAPAQPPPEDTSIETISPFHGFLRWSEWLHERVGRTDGIALVRLMRLLFEFLVEELRLDARQTAEALWRDYQRGGRRDKPTFLKDFLETDQAAHARSGGKPRLGRRQVRHLGGQGAASEDRE